MASSVSTKMTSPIANKAAAFWSQQSTTRKDISKKNIQTATVRTSTRQVLEDRHLIENEVRGTSFRNAQNWVRPSETLKYKRWEAATVDTRDYPSENLNPRLKSLSDFFKKWVQEQKQNAQLLARQVLTAYQIAMTDVVDHMYISSAEPVSFIQGNFAPVNEIGDKVRIQVVEGQVPKDFPPGCYIRNGPNPRFGAHQNLDSPLFGGKTLYSWFEGEGMVHATYFEEDGSVWYKNKYIETESFKLETEFGRSLFLPTMDEQSSPGTRFNRIFNAIRYGKPQRNPGNTSIFEHAGHVVATVEGGKPFEINISDLSTIGEYHCNGHWNRRFFGPHPKIYPDSNEMVVYGFDIFKPYYIIGVLSADGEQMINKLDLDMGRLVLMHDIGITNRHIIVYDFPVVMDIFKMLVKGEPIVSADFNGYSKIGVISILGDEKSIKWFDVETACISHHCNTYEEGDEIVVHGLVTANLQLISVPSGIDKHEWYSRGMTLDHQNSYEVKYPSIDGSLYEHIHEWRLNIQTGAVTERDITQSKFPLELPRINDQFTGKKYRYVYACSEDMEASKRKGYPMFGTLVKVDVSHDSQQLAQFHDVGENTFASEPVFIARPGSKEEDDGWIVTYVHNELTNISDMIIIDAQNFDQKPVARVRFPTRIPYGFHGTFIPSK